MKFIPRNLYWLWTNTAYPLIIPNANYTLCKEDTPYDRNTQFIDALVADGAFSVLAGDKSYTGEVSGWGQAWGTEFDASRVVRTSTETRMKNVAFLYIVKAG